MTLTSGIIAPGATHKLAATQTIHCSPYIIYKAVLIVMMPLNYYMLPVNKIVTYNTGHVLEVVVCP